MGAGDGRGEGEGGFDRLDRLARAALFCAGWDGAGGMTGGAAAARGSGILVAASGGRGSGAALSVQAEIATGGGRRVPGRHRRGGGARRGRGVGLVERRAARGRVERRGAAACSATWATGSATRATSTRRR
jgi:hypothetical protein